MKACPCLAGFAALALALTVATVPVPASGAQPGGVAAPAAPAKDELARNLNSPHAHTAIGAVIDANGGKVPTNGEEFAKTLAKLGDFVQLPVPFSAVALHSGLTHPRVVITMRPSSHPGSQFVFVPNKQSAGKPPASGFGGWGGPSGSFVAAKPEPLNHIATNHTQLEGRLFLAANTETDGSGNLRVKTVEFISWNTRKLKFDFGVIDGLGEKPELRILDGVRCFTCHKNRGPIIGAAPWSNTTANALVRNTLEQVVFHPLALPTGEEVRARPNTDGIALLDPHGAEVDAAVRIGGDLLRDRATFQLLLATAEGRKAFSLLLTATIARGPIEKHDKQIKADLNAIRLTPFLRDAHALHQAAFPSTLIDFSPVGQVKKEVFSKAESGELINQVLKYDEARAAGNRNLPPTHVPSNPKAFVRPTTKAPQQASDLISGELLARTIGLTEQDREFLADALDEALKRLKSPATARLALATQIFSSPSFHDMMTSGELPDRDDFKDRFVAAITSIMKNRKLKDDFWVARDTYASAPVFDPRAKLEKDADLAPSHACFRCHDVQGAGKAAFNPIPMLAFDPFDPTARDAWLKTADRKKKVEVLSRIMRRVGTHKDMPPEDSTEYEMYRVKDPAALNALKDWLDAELKKAKGN